MMGALRDLIENYQQNAMLILSGIFAMLIFIVILTKSIPPRRKRALIFMEASAMLLLIFDRFAYQYAGSAGTTGYWMVRISNFFAFFMVLAVIAAYNANLIDLFLSEGVFLRPPRRLVFVNIILMIGAGLVIISQFTGLYYSFDANNFYHRGSGFMLAYIVPYLSMATQLSVIIQYYKRLRPAIRVPLLLFSLVSIGASTTQAFTYGISLTDIGASAMVIVIYVFALRDMNDKLAHASKIEIAFLKEEHASMKRLFGQTATALVDLMEMKNPYMRGHSARVAKYAKLIAQKSGLEERECDEVYFAALLHDIGKNGIEEEIADPGDIATEEENEVMKQHVVIGAQILSEIGEFPFLKTGAAYHHEHYDGTGYPEKLKGEGIPAVARIIAVADAYDDMTSKKNYREVLPQRSVREAFIKGKGTLYDPAYADIMIRLIDEDKDYRLRESAKAEDAELVYDLTQKRELHCNAYKEHVSEGIAVTEKVTKISLGYRPDEDADAAISIPAIILFDSYDGCVHKEARSIRDLHYVEYGEVWFDGHFNETAARNMKVETATLSDTKETDADEFVICHITAVKFRDHIRITISDGARETTAILALENSVRKAYLGLTGEHCLIREVEIEETDERADAGTIPRIAEEISFIDRLEGDLPNVQVDGMRSAFTEGVPVTDGMRLSFHTMSLPSANLVWHCPYIQLYHSEDGTAGGADHHEYALVRLDGENTAAEVYAKNEMSVRKSHDFAGWDAWEDANKKGYDCEVIFHRRKNRITMVTENLGIAIRNVTTVTDGNESVYVCLTGDRCALTDIRVH